MNNIADFDDAMTKEIFRTWQVKNFGKTNYGRSVEYKHAIVDYFKSHAKILIVTDAGSEGLNLQFCNTIINYDLPWNPQKIEQRIGRCHRYGQTHDVVAINLLNTDNEADRRVYDILSKKFELFEGVFGASDVALGALESGVSFEKRILDIYQNCKNITAVRKAFAVLNRQLDARKNAHAAELRSILLTESREAKGQALEKTKADIDKYLRDVEYWNQFEEPEVDHKLHYWKIDNWGEKIFGSHAKCPTIILSTVDKFARLPWDVNTNALFGRVDRICSRDGYVAIGADHARHTRTEELPTATLRSIKPFLPPELIIQDELHLITGPLGTVYGAYETVIEDLCSYTIGGKKIKPKYVVSTATIKNAAEQTKCLYGRKVTAQFPPNGFEIGDSFYIREVPVEQDPFRRYVGVCAPGQSVKTALLRVYSIILQSAYNLSLDDEYKDVIDPYYTLVGYYNSIRELGGAVRLLQDDIPDRIQRIKKKYGMSRQRFLNHKVEITSRMSSYDIPKKLSQLETPYTDRNCLDTAIATNMIAVGMDVDRLGLMVVTGQPKQNSEYIQATSRIGRS